MPSKLTDSGQSAEEAELSRLREELAELREANAELARKVDLLSEVQVIGGMGSWREDPETGRFILSPEIQRLFEVAPAVAPTAEEALSAIHPDDREAARAVLVDPVAEGETRSARVRLRDIHGKIRWVQIIGKFGRPDGREPQRYGITQDISQLAQTEHELAESRERWQLALEGSQDGVWDWNLATDDVHYSDRWKTMLGYEPHEIYSGLDQWERLVHPDDYPETIAAARDYLEGRSKLYEREFRMKAKDGSWRWILARGKAVFDPSGKPTRMLGTHTDITHRKKEEEAFKRLSLVASKTTTGVIITDAEGRFSWVNKAFERLSGYTLDEVIGRTPGELLQGPATDPATRDLMHERVARGQGFNVEVLNYRKSGIPYWVEVEATPVHNEEGQLESFIAIETDITNRRLDRERIEESERRFRDISNAAGEYIWETDVDGCFTYVTERVQDVMGYPPGEFIGMHNVDLAAPEDREALARRIDEVVSRREAFSNFEVKLLHRDGREMWQSINGVPKFDRQGAWVGYRGAALDITRRKQVEEELSGVNQRFKLATNSARIGIWEYDPVNDRLEWDAIMHQILRLPPEKFRPDRDAWAQVIAPEDLPEFNRTLDTALQFGGNYQLNFRSSRPREDTRYITGNVLVVMDERGQPLRMIGSNWDVTEQKSAEAKALQARDEAEAANRAKGAFLAMMSHEIRTPMNGVIGMIDVIADTPLDQQQREYLDTIRSSSESLMTIINDILDYSKVDAGHMQLDKQPMRIEPLVSGALSLFATHAREKKLELVQRIDKTTPEAIIGDETRIRQILVNLISNAVKFTDRGRVTVKVSGHLLTDNRYEVHFSVTDTGQGLDEQQQSLLFQPFTQADASTTRKHGGTGLGLAISKSLVELMNGQIWFESSRLLGTIFHFTIEAEKTVPPSQPPKPSTITSPPGVKIYAGRILLAEDNPVNAKVARFVLNRFGCVSDLAENGEQVLAMHRANPYDLILMDVQMPEMDGIEATRIIREEAECADFPWIVGLSAAAMPEDQATAREAGMNDFVTKPLRPADLEAALLRAHTKITIEE